MTVIFTYQDEDPYPYVGQIISIDGKKYKIVKAEMVAAGNTWSDFQLELESL